MKIIVLHGEDIGKSYERLKKFIETARSRSWEVNFLDESPLSFNENLSSPSLFGDERFFIHRQPKLLTKKEFEFINSKMPDLAGTLIIYSESTLPVTFLKSLPKDIKIEEFKLPVILWSFLDNIYPKNTKNIIRDLHKICETEAPEFVFSLISKLFRDLYWVKVDTKSVQLPPWRQQKLLRQADKFTVQQLEQIIGILSDIDIDVKTSKAELLPALDLMLIKHLE